MMALMASISLLHFLLLLFRTVVCLNSSVISPSSNTNVATDLDPLLDDNTTSIVVTHIPENITSTGITETLSTSTGPLPATVTESSTGSASLDNPSVTTTAQWTSNKESATTTVLRTSTSASVTTTMLGTPDSISDTTTIPGTSTSASVTSTMLGTPDSISDTTTIPGTSDSSSVTMTGPATSEEPVTIRTTCFPGFQCIHGQCLTEFSCECDAGWTGLFCQVSCPENCSPDGMCGMSPFGQAVCLCADRGVTFDAENGCSSGSETTTQQPTLTSESMGRSLSERECFMGFRCVHGYCQLGLLRCVCDDGWVGQFCHEPCTLDCRGRGVCAENEMGDQYCDCFSPEFSGSNCGLPRSREESSNISNSTPPSFNTSLPWQALKSENQTMNMDLETSTNVMTSGNGSEPQTTPNARSTQSTPSKECALGFSCVHGTCIPDMIKCECEPGWVGYFCHKLAIPQTTGSNIPDVNVTDVSTNVPLTTIKGFDWLPLEGYGNLSDYSLRNCALGFVCRYGNCSYSNGTEIKCDCEPGFAGHFCHRTCPHVCGERAVCKVNETDFWCECNYPYTGFNCSEIRQFPDNKESSSHWYAIGVALAIVLILVLVLVVIPYTLWKRRNITVMKIVFWLRSYEEDDGRDYDAFVAYASSDKDRKFVQSELIPNLEERLSFTLCIHERDFIPGKYIAANINEAVKKSRRTLIIVSPSFVKRKWCQFEFEVAVREMVEQKHRILPIILGDLDQIKTEMSDTLKHILSTVTYLEYPAKDATEKDIQRFWTKIELSMPKKRSKQTCDPSLFMSNTSFPRSSTSSKSQVATEQINIGMPMSACQPLPSSNIDKKLKTSSKRQLQNVVKIPATGGNNSHRDSKDNSYLHGGERLQRQKSQNEQNPSIGNIYEVAPPLPQTLPGHFVYPTSPSYWDCSTGLSLGEVNHQNSPSSPHLFLPSVITQHLQLQNSSTSRRPSLSQKSSKKRPGVEKRYICLDGNGAFNPHTHNMVTPVYEISQNFLGNQSLISFI